MTKQVDFYLIENQVAEASYKLASRLSNKLLKLNKKTLIVTDTTKQTERLDHWLWSFSGPSFVAHENVTEATDKSMIHIADTPSISAKVLQGNYDVLINLCQLSPEFSHHFSRIADIVEQDEVKKISGRERYKTYQKEGYTLKMHTLEL